eukprot:Skav223957  [mRNA]  locus=scaffold3540:139458:140009:+ [translate_table: standard]
MRKEDWCSALWKAVSESVTYGYPTDTYLAMSLREKSVEAPLSFLLQSFITSQTFSSTFGSSAQSEPIQATLSTQVTQLSSFVSMALSMSGTVKAAYVNYHLDLASHLDALEGDRKPMKHAQDVPGTPMQLPSPAQPTLPSSPGLGPRLPDPPGLEPRLPSPPGLEPQWAPIQVGMPRGIIDKE